MLKPDYRVSKADSLRRFADWLDANPEAAESFYLPSLAAYTQTIEHALTLRQALGKVNKFFIDTWLEMSCYFGQLKVEINLPRSEACVRRVVGTEEVPEKVIPAHVKEIVEWDCSPILANDEAVAP